MTESRLYSQKNKVLDHLKSKKSITSWQAFESYSITRLSSLILRLRNDGHQIETVMINENGDRVSYAKYIYTPIKNESK